MLEPYSSLCHNDLICVSIKNQLNLLIIVYIYIYKSILSSHFLKYSSVIDEFYIPKIAFFYISKS